MTASGITFKFEGNLQNAHYVNRVKGHYHYHYVARIACCELRDDYLHPIGSALKICC